MLKRLTITDGGNNNHLSSTRHFVIEQVKQQVFCHEKQPFLLCAEVLIQECSKRLGLSFDRKLWYLR